MRLKVKMLVLLAMISPLCIHVAAAAVMKQTMADIQGSLVGEPPRPFYYSLYVRPPVHKRQVDPNEAKSLGHPHSAHFEEGFKVVAKAERLRGGFVDVSQGQLVYEGTIPPKQNPADNEVLVSPKLSAIVHDAPIQQSHIVREMVLPSIQSPIIYEEVPSSYVAGDVISTVNQTPVSHEVKTVTWNGHIFDQDIVPQEKTRYIYEVIPPTKENEIIQDSYSTNYRIIQDAPPPKKEFVERQNLNINILPTPSSQKLVSEQSIEKQEATNANIPVHDTQHSQKNTTDEVSNPDDLLIFIDEPIAVEEPEGLYDPFGYNGDEYVSIEEHFGDEGHLKASSGQKSQKYPITTYRPDNPKYYQSSGNIIDNSTLSKHKEKLMKLMDKPKKFMKVIKTLGAGHYVPSAVPGIMVAVEDGSEEAFVPEDIIRSSDFILETAASENLLSFAVPEDQLAVESGLNKREIAARAPVPMKGMPYNFGWIVDDEATANYQTRQETANNEGVVMGCYQVLEPTGLVRTVTYIADDGGFRVLNLTKGPDKTPCPGIEEAGRFAANSAKSFNRPPPPPPPTTPRTHGVVATNNFQSSFSHSSSNFSSSNFSSNSFNSVNNAIAFERPTTPYYPPPPTTTTPTTPRPTPPVRVPITTAAPTQASAGYSLAGSAQQAWMTEYLRNITQHLYSSFTNSSTQTNIFGGGSQGLINFPFVMIPITTFLELQRKGAIDSNTQTYGAFIQPQLAAGFAKSLPSQIVQPQQQQQQRQQQQAQKVVQKTTTNVYNTTQTKVKQVKHRQEGVNTLNYQINGVEGQAPKVTQQVANQYKSSQSSHEAEQSSSSSSSSTSSNVNYNAGGQRQLAQQSSQHSAHSNQASQAAKSSSSSSKHYNNVGQGQVSQQYNQQQSSQQSESSKSSTSSNSIQSNFVGSNGNSAFRQPVYATPFTVRPSKRPPTQLSTTIRQPIVSSARPNYKYNVLPKQLTQKPNHRGQQNIQNSFQSHMSSESSQSQNSKSSNSNNIIVSNNGNQQVSQAYQSQQASKESKAGSSSSSSRNSIANINNGRQQLSQHHSQQKASQSSSSSSSSSSFNSFQSNLAGAQTGRLAKQISPSINAIPRTVQPTPAFGTRIPARKPNTIRQPVISPRPAVRPIVVSRPVSTTRRPVRPPSPVTTTLASPKPNPHTFSSVSFNVPRPIQTSPASTAKSGSFSSQSSQSSQASQNEQSRKSNSLVQSNISPVGASYTSQNSSSSNVKSSNSNDKSSQYIFNGGNSNIQQASLSSSKSSSSSASSSQSSFQSFSGTNAQNIPTNIQPVTSIPIQGFSTPAAITAQAVTYKQPIPRKAPHTPSPLKVEEFITPIAEPIFKSRNMEGWIPMTSKPHYKQPKSLQQTSSTSNLGNQFQFSSASSKSSNQSSNSNQSQHFSGTWAGPTTATSGNQPQGKSPQYSSIPASQNIGAVSSFSSSSSSNSASSQSSSSQSSQQYSGTWNGDRALPHASFTLPPTPQIPQFQTPKVPQFQAPEIPQLQTSEIPQFHAPHIPQFETFGVPNSFQIYDDPQTQVRTWNSQNYGR